jgi:hypothetical protein
MSSAPVRDPLADHLLTPQNAALLFIGYQPAPLPGARRAYGVPGGVNNILIINKVMTPGRVIAIIVNEHLGF